MYEIIQAGARALLRSTTEDHKSIREVQGVLHNCALSLGGKDTSMKVAAAFVCVFGVLVGQCAHAEKANVQRPHWVIIATFIDRTTGKKLAQSQLRGPELEFADATTCKSIVDRIHPVANDNVATVLTCRKVVPVESYL